MDQKSLSELSHLVIGTNSINGVSVRGFGTGFFIERNSKIYFVSAKHTLSGCSDNNQKNPLYPDHMQIELKNGAVTIDVKTIKDTADCLSMVIDPDVIAYKLKKKEMKDLEYKTINDYEDTFPAQKSQLIAWGFPNPDTIQPFISNKFEIIPDTGPTKEYGTPFSEIHYCIAIQDKVVSNDLKGFSGAPVFLKNVENDKFVFIGVWAGTYNEANGLLIVKPRYLYELIN